MKLLNLGTILKNVLQRKTNKDEKVYQNFFRARKSLLSAEKHKSKKQKRRMVYDGNILPKALERRMNLLNSAGGQEASTLKANFRSYIPLILSFHKTIKYYSLFCVKI